MSINLHLPTQNESLTPTITVIGVGGAGGNAVNNMINARLEGVEFVVANTDAQALGNSLTERIIQLGSGITRGLGAGADPSIGKAAAEESIDEIAGFIQGSNMVFITAGMGGGTGTGAAPVVARLAREQGILTVGVVTKPFQFEGHNRMKLAEAGLEELQSYVDTLIIIPNQNLFRLANEKTTFADAFRMADEVLHSGVRGVTDLMVKPGLVNLDFADIRTVMREMGKAMMGTGEASGENRAIDAAESAISNPLLDEVSLKGAKAALINITGGSDMTLFEVDEAANRIREEVDLDANIIFGSTFNTESDGMMRVSVVATGIDSPEAEKPKQQKKVETKKSFSYMPPRPNETVTNLNNTQNFSQELPKEEKQENTINRQQQPISTSSVNNDQIMNNDLFNQNKIRNNNSINAEQINAEETRNIERQQNNRTNSRYNDYIYESEKESSFGFLNKIAEVGKALSGKEESKAEAIICNVRDDNHRNRPEIKANNNEEYYDIPAFLRRKPN